MDIDDILREADPDFETTPRGNRDLQSLTRAWVAERSAPELLEYAQSLILVLGYPFDTDRLFRWPADGLIERVNERVKKQIEKVEEMTGDMDAKTNFSLIVIQTELERWKYLVRSYLRTRIAKVCAIFLRPDMWTTKMR